MKDYYYILGITKFATVEEIKASYRKLSLKLHPDQNQDDRFFGSFFIEIKEAYEILTNPKLKSKYDRELKLFNNKISYRSNSRRFEQEIINKYNIILNEKELELKQKYEAEFLERIKNYDHAMINKPNKKRSKFISYTLTSIFISTFSFGIIMNINTSDKDQYSKRDLLLSDSTMLKNKIAEWNTHHNTKALNHLKLLYDDSVLYYGKFKTNDMIVTDKRNFFNKNVHFYRKDIGKITFVKLSQNKVQCNFIKQTIKNKVCRSYPSYLIFRKTNNKWLISTEGDLVTDKILSLSYKPTKQ